MASPVSLSPGSSLTENVDNVLTAVVKGAGPSGLAAAIVLAQTGFDVQVVEKRPARPIGKGRQNMVALRPEALRQLEFLGALQSIVQKDSKNGNVGCITRMTEGKTTSELDGSVFEWPLKRYPGAEPANASSDEYQIPSKINEQVPSSFINLGDLEDCLAQAATAIGVRITYDGTIHLSPDECSNTFFVILETRGVHHTSLGTPDLIVCASGKNDLSVIDELKIERASRVVLSNANFTKPNDATRPLNLRLQDEMEELLESQLYSVFGVRDPSLPMGTLDHVVRKHVSGSNQVEQPVVEIQMNHATAAHLILQHPRSDPPLHTNTSEMAAYILNRVNAHLNTTYTSIQHLKDSGNLVWGDPLTPVTVETVTAPHFVYGDNVVLIGDCAMSCSPTSGLGADIGMTVDSQSVRVLAEATRGAHGDKEKKRKALADFNLRKAESAVIWSQGSRMFYLTERQANGILQKL